MKVKINRKALDGAFIKYPMTFENNVSVNEESKHQMQEIKMQRNPWQL